MLEGKDGGRNQYRYLFGVRNSLKGRPDGNFRFSEAHIAANEAVHGAAVFHILLHRLGGPLLIRRILVHKGRFQFFLQISIGRKGKAIRGTTFGVKLNQFLGNVLDARFGGRFQVTPGFGAQFIDARRLPFLGTETGNLVQGMHGNKDHVSPAVGEFHHFPFSAEVIFYLHQAAENTHTVIYMDNIITTVEGA